MGRYVLTVFHYEAENEEDVVRSYIFDSKKKGIQFLNKKYHEFYDEWKASEDPEIGVIYVNENKTIPPDVDEKIPIITFYGGSSIQFFFTEETMESI